jgi:hypothetical protein
MPTVGQVFIPLSRERETDSDRAHFESLPVPLALWEPFARRAADRHVGVVFVIS